MKKILIDLERMRYPNSGIAKVFASLVHGLSETDRNGLDLTLFGPEENIRSKNFSILDWKKWQKFNPFFGGKFDLVHVSHQLSSYFHRKSKNQKKIVTLHDLNFLHEDFSKLKLNRNISRVKRNVHNADIVVCISEFVKQDYLKNRHLFNIKQEQQVEVIYNGIPFPPAEKEFSLGQYEFLKNKKYFLNIGVLFPKKNQLSLLKAFSFLEQDLVLVVSGGKKNYEEEVLKFIKDSRLENRVHILRNISEEEKFALIQHSEAMIHPSLAEGFGIPPIESMYFGKPVFLSKLTSLPEIGGEHAFYFDHFEPKYMAEKIEEGMQIYQSNPDEYSQNLHQWASQFGYQKMAEKYTKLYKKVLAIS